MGLGHLDDTLLLIGLVLLLLLLLLLVTHRGEGGKGPVERVQVEA